MAGRELPQDHFCPWRDEAEELRNKLAQVEDRLATNDGELEKMRAQLEALTRAVFGKKSEKMPSLAREVGKKPTRAETTKKRAEIAAEKSKLPTEIVEHKVADAQRACPTCDVEAKPAGMKTSEEYDYVPGYFRRKLHQRETLACTCGEYIVTAPAPPRVYDRGQYGPGFIAHLVVQKCGDSLPIYRIEKQFKRLDISISRSTMTELFHRAGELLRPLAARVLALVASSDVVLADETSLPMQMSIRSAKKPKRTYLWTFVSENFIGYRFSPSRSGATPREVLGGTKGTLVVDAYTGYNAVVGVDGRTRAGCLAHARRKFFDALGAHPDAQIALDAVCDVYRIEHEAKELGVARTPEHLEMRQTRSKAILDKLHAWLVDKRDTYLPKSAMGAAIRYALDNWTELTIFLDDVHVPPDNNRSEAALRVAALGRKNFLFVGHEDAGDNIAALYTLVGTCEAHGVNPFEYLRDVLLRVSTHPASDIDALLPHRWASSAAP
jgi:transposase